MAMVRGGDVRSSMQSFHNELYEGYNDYEEQPALGARGPNPGTECWPLSVPSSASDNQGLVACTPLDSRSTTCRTPTAHSASMWRPHSSGRPRARSVASAALTDASRPMTAVRAAGYSSRGARFDPLNQGVKAAAIGKKDSGDVEQQGREMERSVNQLLRDSAAASLAGDHASALEKAKEASKREKALCKYREQAGLGDRMNLELTFAVCFNLGHQYEVNGLQSEALSTYSQIVKNKQFAHGGRLRVNMGNVYYEQRKYPAAIKMYRMALDQTPNAYKETRYKIMRNIGNAFMKLGQYQDAVQSFEAIMELKLDHQTGYNSIVCYYILGNADKMRNCFTKMLILRLHDLDSDDESDADRAQNDTLKEEIRVRQQHVTKYILTAARLIAPVIGTTFVEGYDWVIDMLKDQQYVALAHEMEMDKAIQHLRRKNYSQAIGLLREFQRKEKDLKARAATNLSFLYYLEGDLSSAEKNAELAVKTNRYNVCALVNKGNCLFSRGDVEGAKASYTEAVEVDVDCVEAIYNLGLVHRKLGSLPDALNIFKKLSNVLSNNVEVLFQIGQLNELMGNVGQAIKWLEIVNTRAMHDAGILATLGHLHSNLEDELKALHYYSESHRVYPVNMEIIAWLGGFYTKTEVYEKALPFFNLAHRIEPREVKWQLLAASCYRRTGAYSMALAKYKDISASHPDNVESLRYLVQMCSSLGRKDEAQQYRTLLAKAERQDTQQTGRDACTSIPLDSKSLECQPVSGDDLVTSAEKPHKFLSYQSATPARSCNLFSATTKTDFVDDDWNFTDLPIYKT